MSFRAQLDHSVANEQRSRGTCCFFPRVEKQVFRLRKIVRSGQSYSARNDIENMAAMHNPTKKDGSLSRTILCCYVGRGLEEHLQAELNSPWDVALAPGVSEVAVSVIRNPELINRAPELPIEDVAALRREAEIPLFAEVRVLKDGQILVVHWEATYTSVHSRCIAECRCTVCG